MKVKVGISNKHVHLTEEDYNILFDEPISKKKDINQPGQFASNQKVTIKTKDKEIKNVTLVGPFRNYTQVEISKTDAIHLKIDPPVRASGALEGASEITIKTDKAEITRKACIIPNRHIHITKKQRDEMNLTKDVYNIEIKGEKGGIIYNVHIVENEASYYEMHLDTDDANGHNLKQNDEVEIITD